MPLDCTICTETFGNGVRTIITLIIKAHPLMGVLGLERTNILQKCCGAVLGTEIRITAVPLTAAAAPAAATTSTTVFGWCAVLGGLCNPFPLFSLFTLVRFFWQMYYVCTTKGLRE